MNWEDAINSRNVEYVPSLLVEGLVNQLCLFYESDPKKHRRLCLEVCNKLSDLRLMSPTHLLPELDGLRAFFSQSIIRLFHHCINATNQENQMLRISDVTLDSFPKFYDDRVQDYVFHFGEPINLQISRYALDFDEIEFISQGSFGSVYRCHNRLDNHDYAIKKISMQFTNSKIFLKTLREIRILAQLDNHPNIVSYKTAWLEPRISFAASSVQSSKQCSPLESQGSTDEDSFIVFEKSAPPLKMPLGCDNLQTQCLHLNPATAENNLGNLCDPNEPHPRFPVKKLNSRIWDGATLYVQMELARETLRDWIDHRTSTNAQVYSWCIFIQIMRGLALIHSKGIVHRDLKPSNIFVTFDHCGESQCDLDCPRVQIGDFGLAKWDDEHEKPQVVSTPAVLSPSSTGYGVGTLLYAAPEQIESRDVGVQGDMYSLGIILFELFSCWNTASERTLIISQLRREGIGNVSTNYLEVDRIVRLLLQSDPKKRPNVFQLLRDSTSLLMHAKKIEPETKIIKRQSKKN